MLGPLSLVLPYRHAMAVSPFLGMTVGAWGAALDKDHRVNRSPVALQERRQHVVHRIIPRSTNQDSHDPPLGVFLRPGSGVIIIVLLENCPIRAIGHMGFEGINQPLPIHDSRSKQELESVRLTTAIQTLD
jgi:hypothetical protein